MFLFFSLMKAVAQARIESLARLSQASTPRLTAARSSRP
jgi:hypothetical protein